MRVLEGNEPYRTPPVPYARGTGHVVGPRSVEGPWPHVGSDLTERVCADGHRVATLGHAADSVFAARPGFVQRLATAGKGLTE